MEKTRRRAGRACVSRIMLVFYFLTPRPQEKFSFQAANHDIARPNRQLSRLSCFRNVTTKVHKYKPVTPLARVNKNHALSGILSVLALKVQHPRKPPSPTEANHSTSSTLSRPVFPTNTYQTCVVQNGSH